MPSQLRLKLLEILHEKALESLEKPIRLSSGAMSSRFVDGKKALAEWSDLSTASQAITEAVQEAGIEFDAVGGPTMGADALAVGIAAVNNSRWFFTHKQPKGHGTGRRIGHARAAGRRRGDHRRVHSRGRRGDQRNGGHHRWSRNTGGSRRLGRAENC